MLHVDFSPMADHVREKCPNYTTTFYKERTGVQKYVSTVWFEYLLSYRSSHSRTEAAWIET